MSDNVAEQIEALMQTDEGKAYIESQKAGLLSKNQELLGKLTNQKTELNAYKELGDVDTVKNTLQSAQQQEQERIDNDAQAKQEHLQKQLEVSNSELAQLQTNLVQQSINTELTNAVREARGDESVLIPLLKQSLKGEYSSDGVAISVMENGEVAHREGERMTVKALVDEAKAKHPNLFNLGAQGSGTRQGQRTSAESATYDMSSEDFNLTKAAERNRKNNSYESVTKKYGWR